MACDTLSVIRLAPGDGQEEQHAVKRQMLPRFVPNLQSCEYLQNESGGLV